MMQPTAEQRAAWEASWLSRPEPADYRNWLERKLAALEIENAALKATVERPSADPTEVIAIVTIENRLTNETTVTVISVPSLHLTCPFDGQKWCFHKQEQVDMLQKHLEWHAMALTAENAGCPKCGGRDVISSGPTEYVCQHCADAATIETLEVTVARLSARTLSGNESALYGHCMYWNGFPCLAMKLQDFGNIIAARATPAKEQK